jgi:hypothetical protein
MSINNTLTTATGIDSVIQSVQTDLYSNFTGIWSGDVSAYGRVHKNPANVGDEVPDYYRTSKIVVPEWYNSALNDYEEVFYDDNYSCVFCFLIGDRDSTKDGLVFTADVKCVFMMDLSKVYPGIVERQDAKAQNEVADFMRDNANGRYIIQNIERGIDTIFYEYKTRGIRFSDMQPLHCFSVNLKLMYYLKC